MSITLYDAANRPLLPEDKFYASTYFDRVSEVLTLKVDLTQIDLPIEQDLDVRISFSPKLLYSIELVAVNTGKFDPRTLQYQKAYLDGRPEIIFSFKIARRVPRPPIALSFVIMIFEQHATRKVLFCDGGYIG